MRPMEYIFPLFLTLALLFMLTKYGEVVDKLDRAKNLLKLAVDALNSHKDDDFVMFTIENIDESEVMK